MKEVLPGLVAAELICGLVHTPALLFNGLKGCG